MKVNIERILNLIILNLKISLKGITIKLLVF